MSSVPPEPPADDPADTAAFTRFYQTDPEAEPASPGLLYRLLISWWRDR